MVEVFRLSEASLHAWRNLGLTPEIKARLESAPGASPEDAYLRAIIFVPWVKLQAQNRGGPVSLRDLEAAIYSDPTVLHPVLRALGGRTDPALPGRLKSDAARIARMSSKEAWDYFTELASEIKSTDPEGYNDPERTVLDLGGGWRWTEIGDQACRGREGELMQHCGQAMGMMLSLRDPSGRPHVTAALEIESGLEPGVHQLRGKQNRVPDRRYWGAIGSLFASLPEEQRRLLEPGSEFDELRAHLGVEGPDPEAVPDDEMEFFGGEGDEDEAAFFNDEDREDYVGG